MVDNIIYDIEVYEHDELLSKQVKAGVSGNRHPRYVMEPDELLFLRNFLDVGDVVVDCGANIGLHSINFADVVGDKGKIYSFEPVLQNFMLLCRNLLKYSFDSRIVPINASLGESSGVDLFYLNPVNMGDCRPCGFWLETNPTVIVPRITLGEYFSLLPNVWNDIRLIKIDTQGCEFGILQGAEDMFIQYSNMSILMEYWPYALSRNKQNAKWFFSFLKRFGFNIFDVTDGKRNYLSFEDVKVFYSDHIDIDTHINLFLTKEDSI